MKQIARDVTAEVRTLCGLQTCNALTFCTRPNRPASPRDQRDSGRRPHRKRPLANHKCVLYVVAPQMMPDGVRHLKPRPRFGASRPQSQIALLFHPPLERIPCPANRAENKRSA
jgi:hypothetical protein